MFIIVWLAATNRLQIEFQPSPFPDKIRVQASVSLVLLFLTGMPCHRKQPCTKLINTINKNIELWLVILWFVPICKWSILSCHFLLIFSLFSWSWVSFSRICVSHRVRQSDKTLSKKKVAHSNLYFNYNPLLIYFLFFYNRHCFRCYLCTLTCSTIASVFLTRSPGWCCVTHLDQLVPPRWPSEV